MLDAIRDAFLNFQDVGQHVGFVLERAFQRVLEEIRMTTSKDEDELLLLLFEVEKMVDTCWQQLHVVHYAQVPRIWREMYTFCVALKSEILLLTIDDADNLNRVVKMKREAVWWLDMGLVMAGAPVLRREILDRVVELQHDLNHLRHMKRVKRLFPVVSRELALERKRDIGFPVQAFQADRVDWDTYRVLASSQRPFLLKNALESHGWPALEKWRDMAYLLETVGEDRVVPVEIGRAYTEEGWTQKLMRFGEFMQQYILNEDQERKGYLAQHNLFHQLPHLERETCPPDYACLEFGDKGMISSRDLIVNTWFGPADTISPLHTDPYDNLFAQVVGFKYLRLYAPEEGQKLFPYPSESLVSNTSQIVDVDRVSDEMSNTFQQARYVETIVGPGDLLYSCVCRCMSSMSLIV